MRPAAPTSLQYSRAVMPTPAADQVATRSCRCHCCQCRYHHPNHCGHRSQHPTLSQFSSYWVYEFGSFFCGNATAQDMADRNFNVDRCDDDDVRLAEHMMRSEIYARGAPQDRMLTEVLPPWHWPLACGAIAGPIACCMAAGEDFVHFDGRGVRTHPCHGACPLQWHVCRPIFPAFMSLHPSSGRLRPDRRCLSTPLRTTSVNISSLCLAGAWPTTGCPSGSSAIPMEGWRA